MTLTAAYLDALNKLIDIGIYHDHQDAIRDGLRQLFRFHKIQPFFPELVDKAEEDSYGS